MVMTSRLSWQGRDARSGRDVGSVSRKMPSGLGLARL